MTEARDEADFIPIAAVNQYNFCPHRCWRMFCAGEFSENQYTIEGTSLHDRVHTVGEGNREEVYQEAFEIQGRLLGKFLMGETEVYPPLVVK